MPFMPIESCRQGSIQEEMLFGMGLAAGNNLMSSFLSSLSISLCVGNSSETEVLSQHTVGTQAELGMGVLESGRQIMHGL